MFNFADFCKFLVHTEATRKFCNQEHTVFALNIIADMDNNCLGHYLKNNTAGHTNLEITSHLLQLGFPMRLKSLEISV